MTNTSNSIELQKVIDNIAKKKHVVSEQAIRAKERLAHPENAAPEHRVEDSDHDHDISIQETQKQTQHLIAFNKSITALSTIFKQSQFDELVLLIEHPARMFMLNFCKGLLRGLGFTLGMIMLISILMYSLSDVLMVEILSSLLDRY
jgi:hypothetical protein